MNVMRRYFGRIENAAYAEINPPPPLHIKAKKSTELLGFRSLLVLSEVKPENALPETMKKCVKHAPVLELNLADGSLEPYPGTGASDDQSREDFLNSRYLLRTPNMERIDAHTAESRFNITQDALS